jgi:Uma2 family endonuclease
MLRVPFLSTRRYNVERMALSQITWQDVQQLPDDGHRHEAIEGELYVTPAPSSRHQRISRRLLYALEAILGAHGELFFAPIGVEFPDTQEGVQPDLVFVSRSRSGIIVQEGIRGAPDLVVEILSPTTAHRDRGVKRKLYERQGVEQYWIVDLETQAIEVWNFGERPSEAPALQRFTGNLPVWIGGERVGEIDLAEVFTASS